jgi:hypothetical protein
MEEDEAKQLFKACLSVQSFRDTSEKDYLNEDGLREVMRVLNLEQDFMEESSLSETLKSLDKDGDGKVTFEDFKIALNDWFHTEYHTSHGDIMPGLEERDVSTSLDDIYHRKAKFSSDMALFDVTRKAVSLPTTPTELSPRKKTLKNDKGMRSHLHMSPSSKMKFEKWKASFREESVSIMDSYDEETRKNHDLLKLAWYLERVLGNRPEIVFDTHDIEELKHLLSRYRPIIPHKYQNTSRNFQSVPSPQDTTTLLERVSMSSESHPSPTKYPLNGTKAMTE